MNWHIVLRCTKMFVKIQEHEGSICYEPGLIFIQTWLGMLSKLLFREKNQNRPFIARSVSNKQQKDYAVLSEVQI